jgi:hypothetical protein
MWHRPAPGAARVFGALFPRPSGQVISQGMVDPFRLVFFNTLTLQLMTGQNQDIFDEILWTLAGTIVYTLNY